MSNCDDLLKFPVPGVTEQIAGLWFAWGDQYPGWHYVVSQYLWEPFGCYFFLHVCLARKWIWDILGVCVYVTRMPENDTTTYVSNLPPFCWKTVNEKAKGMEGILASYKNEKWEYSV